MSENVGIFSQLRALIQQFIDDAANDSVKEQVIADIHAKALANLSDPECFLWSFAGAIIETAKKLESRGPDAAQGRLVDLMSRLVKLPEVTLTIPGWGPHACTLWKDFPIFGPCLREDYDVYHPTNNDPETVNKWVNFNAFTARIQESGLRETWNFCLWTCRASLEGDEAIRAHSEHGRSRAYSVLAAAEWFIIASPSILKEIQKVEDRVCHETERWKGEIPEGGICGERSWMAGKYFDGPWRMGIQRWNFWKNRLADFRDERIDCEGLSEDISRRVQLALQKMDEAEADILPRT